MTETTKTFSSNTITSDNLSSTPKEIQELKLSFDLNTLDHLGVKLYYEIPSMLAELISNSWDADASIVDIFLNDNDDKEIIIIDDGIGMTFDELNDCYLKIGRNRRVETSKSTSPSGRKILGKKGLGKLSVFGVGKTIEVTSVKNNYKTSFIMNYDDIKSSNGEYKPSIIDCNVPTSETSYTKIIIKDIQRKSDFDINSLGINISKRFNIFSNDFIVKLHHNNISEVKITNELHAANNNEFTWSIPNDFNHLLDEEDYNFLINNSITGTINTTATPLTSTKSGIILYSRGKLVQEPQPFNDRANDNFYQYMYGYINIDYIDEKPDIDFTSTNRKSIVWDIDKDNTLSELLSVIKNIVSKTASDWKKRRKQKKEINICATTGIDLQVWLDNLTPSERPLAKKLTDAILKNDNISISESEEYISNIQSMFDFKTFQDFTQELDNLEMLGDEKAIQLLNDWQIIESKELAKIASGRIKTIDQFEKYIRTNASETKVIQKFLEEFPWLLDSRMNKFQREVTYTKLLKENFIEKDLPNSNRRIDFLCSNESGVIHIIELKRPNIKITAKEISQIASYISFIKRQFPQMAKIVRGYLISDNMNYDEGVELMIESFEQSQNIFVKSYSDLLAEARNFNKEFIIAYESIQEKK